MNTRDRVTRMMASAMLTLIATLYAMSNAAAQSYPPPLVNYQGVLRDAAGQPLDGAYDMVFRFYSADIGGDEFLVDTHTMASGGRIVVTGGLFNAVLFSGTVTDGGGPGIFLSAFELFQNSEVWLQVEVGHDMVPLEPLTPRVRIVSAPYAMNAASLGGSLPSHFLDVTDAEQTKYGRLNLSRQEFGVPILDVTGANYAARFANTTAGGGEVQLSVAEGGLKAWGSRFVASFQNTADGSRATVGADGIGVDAVGGVGVQGTGTLAAGSFREAYGNSSATLGSGDVAVQAVGGIGVDAFASTMGGRFINSGGTSEAYIAQGDIGIEARGSGNAGFFIASNLSSSAQLGMGSGTGLLAWGTPGVYAIGATGNSQGGLAHSGLGAFGSTGGGPTAAAGFFRNNGDDATVYLGIEGEGVRSQGTVSGGFFESTVDSDARAWLAGDSTPPGCARPCYSATWGIWSEGAYSPGQANGGGGFFKDSLYSGYAKVGHENYGIQGFGNSSGGYFKDANSSGEAHIASSDYGIYAFGSFVGGAFSHPNYTTFWANVATATHKIQGTGAVSFVQNHPHDPDKVIVYSSPEGDEVATYTRGRARLRNGEARVVLGETFAMVTNPDLGLTAHLTPRGEEAIALSVASLSTGEIIVVGPRGSNADFDYLVYGLRIGFEEAAVVQPKEREARLPEQSAVEAPLKGDDSLRPFRAFDRFAAMEQETGRSSAALSAHRGAAATPGSAALRAAIEAAGVNDVGKRKKYGPEMVSEGGDVAADNARREEALARRNGEFEKQRPSLPSAVPPLPRSAAQGSSLTPVIAQDSGANQTEKSLARSKVVVTLPAGGGVEPFDLVALDGTTEGEVRPASRAADRAVVGIALEVRDDGSVDVVVGGVTSLRVDATYGSIRVGDLLTASTTPGHAMRSPDAAAGSVVAKALESLDVGTGVIRVLVMNR